MAIPLLEAIPIEGKLITGDALLTQRGLADYLVLKRHAHYHFTVKANQPTLLQDLQLFFKDRSTPGFIEEPSCDHGRIETRKIWTTVELNPYLNFPHVAQAFVIERNVTDKKNGRSSHEIAYGITSQTPEQADPKAVLKANRGHWCIENSCHWIIDWNYDEDRSRISKGYGPENISRLRRFAVGLLKSKGVDNIAQKMRQLTRHARLVLQYMGMTQNSRPASSTN